MFTDLIGSASFVVLDTDYDNYGLICTCQDVNLYLLYTHRRSCSLLHRNPAADNSPTSAQMKELLDSQVSLLYIRWSGSLITLSGG